MLKFFLLHMASYDMVTKICIALKFGRCHLLEFLDDCLGVVFDTGAKQFNQALVSMQPLCLPPNFYSIRHMAGDTWSRFVFTRR